MAKKRVPHLNTNTEDSLNSVISSKKDRKPLYLGEYINYLTMTKEILTTSTAERIARDLIAFVRGDENVIKITQFLESRGINQRTWHRWKQEYECIAEANDFALMVVGNRREIGLLTRKYDSSSTSYMMMHYDTDWRDIAALKAKIMSQEGLSSGQKFIIMEKYPDSPLVPKRVGQDEADKEK